MGDTRIDADALDDLPPVSTDPSEVEQKVLDRYFAKVEKQSKDLLTQLGIKKAFVLAVILLVLVNPWSQKLLAKSQYIGDSWWKALAVTGIVFFVAACLVNFFGV